MKHGRALGALWLACCACSSEGSPAVQAAGGNAGAAGALEGGSSGSGGAAGGEAIGGMLIAGSSNGGGGSGGAPAAGSGGNGGGAGTPSLLELGKAFDGFRMELPCHHYQENPCEPQNSAVPNRGYLCCYIDETIERTNHPKLDRELGFGGDPAMEYDLKLRVRGVVENRDYGGQGTKVGDWVLMGGDLPPPSAIHVFGLTVREPEQTYFLNSWNDTTDPARVIKVDYELTLRVRGGSKVRLFEYDDIGKIWANAEQLKVEGIAPYPNAHEGQFLELGVVSVTPKQ